MDTLALTLEELAQQAILFLPRLVAALVIFLVGVYLANLLTRVVVRGLDRRGIASSITQFISNYVRLALIVLVALVALQQVNFDLTAFIAGLGIVGFTVGFALQDITQNIVAGLILLVQEPFVLGDLVEIDEFTGFVMEINVRTTRLHTLDGRDVLIPNYAVIGHPITNYTKDPDVRVGFQVAVEFGADLAHVRRVAHGALAGEARIAAEPVPEVLLAEIGESALVLQVYYWVNLLALPERAAVDVGLTAVVNAFREANITIPYPIAYEIAREPQKH